MHFIDILFFAAIAGFLVYKLYEVLGQRRGNEKPEGIEFMPPSKDRGKHRHKGGLRSGFKGIAKGNKPHHRLVENARLTKPAATLSEEDAKLFKAHPVLKEFRSYDPSFIPTAFLKGATVAFERIISAFHSRNLKSVQSLLSPSVNEAFTKSLKSQPRPTGKQATPLTLVSLKAELTKAELAKTNEAKITVTFHSEQISQGKTSRVKDKWMFLRHLKSGSPHWILASCH